MEDSNSNSNALYAQLIANTIFTPRQISIILNLHKGYSKPGNISSGAYYRQVKQCKEKVRSLLFSIVLLQSIGIVKTDAPVMLSKLAEQLSVIFSLNDSSDVAPRINDVDVMYVINEVIKRASLL